MLLLMCFCLCCKGSGSDARFSLCCVCVWSWSFCCRFILLWGLCSDALLVVVACFLVVEMSSCHEIIWHQAELKVMAHPLLFRPSWAGICLQPDCVQISLILCEGKKKKAWARLTKMTKTTRAQLPPLSGLYCFANYAHFAVAVNVSHWHWCVHIEYTSKPGWGKWVNGGYMMPWEWDWTLPAYEEDDRLWFFKYCVHLVVLVLYAHGRV